MQPGHRKQVRSYNTPGHAHELTFSCFRRLPLLSRDRTRRWFIEALEQARRKLRLFLWAYVIMPEHVHVLLCPCAADYQVRLIRTALKVPVQRKALRYVREHAPLSWTACVTSNPTGTFTTASGSEAGVTTAT
jgi:putative transposase